MLFQLPASIFGYLLVGLLWGCTNPFIKRAQSLSSAQNRQSSEKSIGGGKLANLTQKVYGYFASVFHSITDKNILIPYAVNQTGSLVLQ